MLRAIELNGVAVDANLQAFELGRVAAVHSNLLESAESAGKQDAASDMSLSEVLARAEQKLADYGCSIAKQDFRRGVAAVRSAEQRIRPGSDELTRAAAQSLLRVLTPKDEYEVARLYREGGFSTHLNKLFVKPEVTYLLAPPLLGESKRRFGAWMGAGFGALARLKRLRGTWLDPFRFTAERKLAQEIRAGYAQDLALVCENLSAQNFDTAVELTRYPQHVRGFGHVRQAQYKQALARCAVLRRVMTTVAQPVHVFDPHAQPVAANQGASSQVA